jgi:hypothetical protein
MCGNCNDPFHGLEDDLDDAFTGPLSEDNRKAGFNLAQAEADRIAGQSFSETCRACRGTGKFRSYSGRTVGDCFKCKGTGTLVFKTSPTARAKSAEQRDRKADQKRIDLQTARAAWIETYAEDFAWMKAKDESFEFAHAMMEAFLKYGSLTERQHATVTRLRIADAERQAARKAEAEARVVNAPVIDVSAIETAFAHAKGSGIQKPKMKLAGFKFSEAPAHGRNAGALYVVRVGDDQYLGKVQDGKFTRVRECDEATQAEVLAVASDPHNAAIAYGRRTGNCAICGRELTNHASIDLGIGPICAEKYGWA